MKVLSIQAMIVTQIKSNAIWFILLLSSIGMGTITAQYTTWKWDVDFLITKQLIIHLDYYRMSFYVHIFSSMVILICGLLLFSKFILHNHPKIHSWSGRIYVILLLLLAAPSGLVMAFHANGSSLTKFSFILLCFLWWVSTFQGYRMIINRKVQQHKNWMIRSFALTTSALSLRLYQLIFGYFLTIDPETQYLVVSWLSWVGNLVIAEIYIRKVN